MIGIELQRLGEKRSGYHRDRIIDASVVLDDGFTENADSLFKDRSKGVVCGHDEVDINERIVEKFIIGFQLLV